MKKASTRLIAFILSTVMLLGMVPMNIFAENGSVYTYEEFMEDFKILETYADEYAGSIIGRDSGELIMNFIRTGVERYQDDNWTTLAGQEIVGFTNYVKMKDQETGSSVMDLRDIVTDEFYLPNGDQTDFGHMFGCMNISYVAKGSADLSGWAGDVCDLLQYCVANIEDINTKTDGTVESMAEYIQKYCLGVDASGAYGWDDFYGDMDAYYLINEYVKGSGKLSDIMEAYFTSELSDVERSVYFMNNRFGVEDSQEAVRNAIYNAYSSDVGLKVLESKRNLTSYNTLRQACCYAFADYIYENAKGKLIANENIGEAMDNEYYTVFSSDYSLLAPGIEQEIKYAKTVDGKQIVYYVATVDVTRDDVTIMANYKDNDPSKGWGYSRVEDQVEAMVKNYEGKYEYFTPVVATNADGYNMSTGEPSGLLVMNGVEWHGPNNGGYFAILKDGSAMIGTYDEYQMYKDQIQEAVGGFGAVLVKDGKINVTKNPNYASTRASRTAVGIKADGSVVMMVLDGRQLPFSAGGSMEEIAQIMYDAGCVHAINLDGGGSSTYLSKPAGSNEMTLVNRPSDGYARSVSDSLVAISFAKSSNEFDHAIVSSDYDYITAGTSMQINVTGVSNTGNTAVIPEGAYWSVSDPTVATIDSETGLLTAVSNGIVIVDYMLGGESVGSKIINVVTPDDIQFAEERIVAVYGEPIEINATVWYEGKPVAFTPLKDVFIFFNYEFDEFGNPLLYFTSDAGVINGLEFTGSDAKGIRNQTIYAALMIGKNIIATAATINLYYADEATFDFENASFGNRTLAWNREVINAVTADNMLYRISDPDSPIEIEYTFALDMTSIMLPAHLEPLQSMLPGADQENVTAWNFMLQLAERVCELTNVRITAQFSENLDIDISELKVVNDYFKLTSATLDEETNTLTIICNWIDQTAAIDSSTANPLCLLAGIKATVKADANYVNNEILISNNGYVSYDAYLAASSLKSFADNPANQAQYGIYPYVHDPACRTDGNDAGGHFSSQYAEFADIYVVNSENRQGWSDDSYYENNVAVTGIQYIPSKTDPTVYLFYSFDEEGICIGEANGLVEYQGDLYNLWNGEKEVGWYADLDADGNEIYYYFDRETGKAVDGVQQIKESSTVFTYTFENRILVRGDLRLRACSCVGTKNQIDSHVGITGWSYRWAGSWIKGEWIEVDGNKYYMQKYHTIADTGFLYKDTTNQDVPHNGYYLFDENGVFQENFTGIYNDYYVENGIANNRSNRIVQIDGYFYCATADRVILKNDSRYVNEVIANGFDIKPGMYYFDEQGRMTNELVTTEGTDKLEGCNVKILGRVVNVTSSAATPAFKVGYVNEDSYVEVKGTKNEDGSYKYVVDEEASGVFFVVVGDANGDGKFDADDAAVLASALTPLGKDLEERAAFAADISGNNRLNSADRILLARALLDPTHPLYLSIEEILKNN